MASTMDQLRNRYTYLALEGGGGKGAAYVGALKKLEDQGFIRFLDPNNFQRKRLDPSRIKGVAGTSAGAITACLLAAGFGSRELEMVVRSGIADQFIDDPKVRRCPVIRLAGKTPAPIALLDNARGLGHQLLGRLVKLAVQLDSGIAALGEQVIKAILPRELGSMGVKVARYFDQYLDSFLWDMGLFTGEGIRAFLDDFLAAKTGEKNVTFAKLFQRTGVHLKVAGVCVNTAEVVWFDHLGPWKNLPVADGVRISMSIPGAFKPIAIDYKKLESPEIDLEGALLFVDGGVLNNLPLHAFDDVGPGGVKTLTKAEALLFGGQVTPPKQVLPLNEHVLALRLTNPADMIPSFYGNGGAMLGGVMNALLAQAETNQIRSSGEAEQTIDLDTSGLSTLEFTVSQEDLDKVTERSAGITAQWIIRKQLDLMKKAS